MTSTKEIIAFLEKEIVRARKMEESGDQAATTNEYRYLLETAPGCIEPPPITMIL